MGFTYDLHPSPQVEIHHLSTAVEFALHSQSHVMESFSRSFSAQKPVVTTDMSKDGGDQSPLCKCAPKPPHSRSPSSPPPPQHTLLTYGIKVTKAHPLWS